MAGNDPVQESLVRDRQKHSRSHQAPSPPRARRHSVSRHGQRHPIAIDVNKEEPPYSYLAQAPSPPRSPHRSRDPSPLNLGTDRDPSPRERRPRVRERRLSFTERAGPSASIPTLLLPEDPREKAARPMGDIDDEFAKVFGNNGGGWSRVRRSVSQSKSSKPTFPNSVPSGATGGLLGDRGYRYRPLAKGEFRVLVLSPARSADISCQIMHCTLKDPEIPYIAISYAWGDVGEKKRIRIRDVGTEKDEEVVVNVTASLESALRALRKRDDRVYVWADALSIDQQNWAEKTEQVRKMTQIYQNAKRVAIWLGPEADDSELALALIAQVGQGAKLPGHIDQHTPPPFTRPHLAATAALFDRDYWNRLWVVQEVFNAREIAVYCGRSFLPWSFFQQTSELFRNSKAFLHRNFPIGIRNNNYYPKNSNLSIPQALRHQGPTSFLELGSPNQLRRLESQPDDQVFVHLLEVMKMCRRKLSSDPKDKIFGVLGVLPVVVREEIPVDYDCSVRDVYINIVDILLRTTGSLDVICEAIHFPPHANNVSIPSWVPDWSYVPDSRPVGVECEFSASGTSRHDARIDPYIKSKLEIAAIYLDTVEDQGISLGTLCTLADYMMAFLHWRSMLLDSFAGADTATLAKAQEDFCLTLCLHQVPSAITSARAWMDLCYHVFASSIQDRLPSLAIDDELRSFAGKRSEMSLSDRRQFIQDHIASRMMGRRFLITADKLMGLGTGFLMRGDIIVVPLGCSTPVVLRPEGKEYRFVGDVYISGYMRGKAIQENKDGVKGRELKKFLLY